MSGPEDLTLGPRSWVWTYSGDWRSMLIAPWVGFVQLAYPGLGAGVEQHSAFYAEPWARLFRSVPQIAGVVYGTDKGTRIRDLHHDFKGVDSEGRRYHALDPEVYYWAHATISEVVVHMVGHFDHEMSEPELELAYHESCAVYRRYGVSTRPVPRSSAAYREYFEHNYTQVLERTPAVTAFIELARDPGSMTQPWLPAPLWKLVAPLVANPAWTLGVGMLHPAARETLGVSWSKADQRRFELITNTVRTAWRGVPLRARYMAPARAGFRREGWPHVPRQRAATGYWRLAADRRAERLAAA
ncbi:oxygenase MpaB family protein [Sciscionella marina]|uniref:oxygenase MpaB family protein n=1 Tax=Sciscionella marina TaxID=508770 RepID=UPI000366AD52|nr:oxygenase MpaB family protein [Sciscionella marina]